MKWHASSVNKSHRPKIPLMFSRTKVFHFILDHRVGGPHVYVRSIAKMLRPELESIVVTTGQGEMTDLAITNLRHKLRLLYPLEVIWNVIRLCWLFRRKQSRCKTIFDVHGAANIAPVLAARLLRIPLVWHFHETLATFGRLVSLGKATILEARHCFVVVAKKSAQVFELGDAILIPGAVDCDFWMTSEFDKGAREQGGCLRLVAVGNLNPLKGMDILLDALDGLNAPWELIIVGAELQTFTEYASSLREKAKRLSRNDRCVKFAGWLSADAVKQLLAVAHIFVLPSRSEACPIALLEAMAMECVCIASDVGDVAEILRHSDNGWVVESGSPERLREALELAISLGPKLRRNMGVQARKTIVERYSSPIMAQRHLDIYRKLL